MKNKINQIVREYLNELMGGGSSVNGAGSFRGGPYGIGGGKQLSGPLDPSVQAIEDKTQAEFNKNADRQVWSNHKFQGTPVISMDERNAADAASGPNLGGYPDHNAIEAPVQHIPNENMMTYDASGRHRSEAGTEEYLVDDIIDELERSSKPEELPVRKESASPGSVRGWPNTAPAVFPGDWTDPDEVGQLGHMTEPGAEMSPPGGYGAILQPKKFIPDEAPQESDLEDADLDGIADRIDLNQAPELRQKVKNEAKRHKKVSTRHRERYGEKDPSGSQISKKFKQAKTAMLELESLLSRTKIDDGSGTMHWPNAVANLFTQLSKIERDIAIASYVDEGVVHKQNLNSEGIKRLVKEEILRQIKEKKKHQR